MRIYKFRQAKQRVNETMDTYYTRLRKLPEYCEFETKTEKLSHRYCRDVYQRNFSAKSTETSNVT